MYILYYLFYNLAIILTNGHNGAAAYIATVCDVRYIRSHAALRSTASETSSG